LNSKTRKQHYPTLGLNSICLRNCFILKQFKTSFINV